MVRVGNKAVWSPEPDAWVVKIETERFKSVNLCRGLQSHTVKLEM